MKRIILSILIVILMLAVAAYAAPPTPPGVKVTDGTDSKRATKIKVPSYVVNTDGSISLFKSLSGNYVFDGAVISSPSSPLPGALYLPDNPTESTPIPDADHPSIVFYDGYFYLVQKWQDLLYGGSNTGIRASFGYAIGRVDTEALIDLVYGGREYVVPAENERTTVYGRTVKSKLLPINNTVVHQPFSGVSGDGNTYNKQIACRNPEDRFIFTSAMMQNLFINQCEGVSLSMVQADTEQTWFPYTYSKVYSPSHMEDFTTFQWDVCLDRPLIPDPDVSDGVSMMGTGYCETLEHTGQTPPYDLAQYTLTMNGVIPNNHAWILNKYASGTPPTARLIVRNGKPVVLLQKEGDDVIQNNLLALGATYTAEGSSLTFTNIAGNPINPPATKITSQLLVSARVEYTQVTGINSHYFGVSSDYLGDSMTRSVTVRNNIYPEQLTFTAGVVFGTYRYTLNLGAVKTTEPTDIVLRFGKSSDSDTNFTRVECYIDGVKKVDTGYNGEGKIPQDIDLSSYWPGIRNLPGSANAFVFAGSPFYNAQSETIGVPYYIHDLNVKVE